MTIDSIVKISIEAQTLSMAQKGFGVPLILASGEETKLEKYRNAGELPANPSKLAAYDMANTIFAQNPTVPLVKIAFSKEAALIDALKSVCDVDSDFYGLLLARDFASSELKDLEAILAGKRLILGIDVNDGNQDAIKTVKSDRIFSIYNPNAEQYLAAAWMAKMLPEAPGSSSWAYQELKKVESYGLSASLSENLEKSFINRYLSIKGIGCTLNGKASSGRFIDITHGIDWLHARMQERLFRVLMINKKIPYTLKGIDLIRTEIIAQLKEAVYQGVLAAEPEPLVSTPTIEEVDETTRGERILPKVRFSGRLAGAIHHIEIHGTVTP
jgi:hypothetical protein